MHPRPHRRPVREGLRVQHRPDHRRPAERRRPTGDRGPGRPRRQPRPLHLGAHRPHIPRTRHHLRSRSANGHQHPGPVPGGPATPTPAGPPLHPQTRPRRLLRQPGTGGDRCCVTGGLHSFPGLPRRHTTAGGAALQCSGEPGATGLARGVLGSASGSVRVRGCGAASAAVMYQGQRGRAALVGFPGRGCEQLGRRALSSACRPDRRQPTWCVRPGHRPSGGAWPDPRHRVAPGSEAPDTSALKWPGRPVPTHAAAAPGACPRRIRSVSTNGTDQSG